MISPSRCPLVAVLLFIAGSAGSARADEPSEPPPASPAPVTSVSGSSPAAPIDPAAPPAPPAPGAPPIAPAPQVPPPPPTDASAGGWLAPPPFGGDARSSMPHRRQRLPREITYKPGMPVFEGYTLDQKSPKWPLAVGLPFFGVGYGGAALIGAVAGGISEDRDEWAPMFVPVVGPFIALETAKSSIEFDGERVVIVASALFQITGLAITALRWVLPARQVLVLDRKVRVRAGLAGGASGVAFTF